MRELAPLIAELRDRQAAEARIALDWQELTLLIADARRDEVLAPLVTALERLGKHSLQQREFGLRLALDLAKLSARLDARLRSPN